VVGFEPQLLQIPTIPSYRSTPTASTPTSRWKFAAIEPSDRIRPTEANSPNDRIAQIAPTAQIVRTAQIAQTARIA
jgi:hypothetical protein